MQLKSESWNKHTHRQLIKGNAMESNSYNIQNSLKVDLRHTCKAQTIKLLEETIGDIICNTGLGKEF